MILTIPEATCSTNDLIRKYRNPHARAKERDRWHYLVREQVKPSRRLPLLSCEILVTRRGRNPLDWDNMGGGLKFLMDALVSNKIIADDKPKVVKRLHLQQETNRKLPAATIVSIVPVLPD